MKRRTSKEVEKKIDQTIEKINNHIGNSTNKDSVYSRGLAFEGYWGGYIQALNDVDCYLRGMMPTNNHFWKEEEANSSNHPGHL